MKVKIGDLVYVKVSVHDFILLEGHGVVVGMADNDDTNFEGTTWIIFCEDEFWNVEETWLTKTDDKNIDSEFKNISLPAKKIRAIYKKYLRI